MFKRSNITPKDRAGKARKISKRSFRDDAKQRLREQLNNTASPETSPSLGGCSPKLNSAIVTIAVGRDQRLFAAHEDVLARSSWFAEACRAQFFESATQRRISLPDEEPEIFSAVLEFLYKGDYYPRLMHDRKRNTWSLEDAAQDLTTTPISTSPRVESQAKKTGSSNESASVFHHGVNDFILRDTVVYCTALKLQLPELQRLALRKQGLQSGIDVATILRSARFAYANTPPSDSRLRAHYLALIICSRKTFKRSGTMQMEMEKGDTQMFFDLFVAMCNHIDDVVEFGSGRTPDLAK
ncbi:BTB/POZ-like protein [Zymoseptoria brevis]|uniref:BTB/POZ-like protein n=1 Tax=Zymoseptoria brevis TaxID=1047168 RepID=A0A0F4G8D4_9PEZI|nr:BTB/POZ-like protein [Zymoseptoria brevis]